MQQFFPTNRYGIIWSRNLQSLFNRNIVNECIHSANQVMPNQDDNSYVMVVTSTIEKEMQLTFSNIFGVEKLF